jgi:aspartate/methionine/tyrosine aminotransferase
MFSSRLRQTAGRNLLAVALERRRAAGLSISDLTLSNPTRAGFTYPPGLLAPLSRAQGLCYEPEPFGLPAARQAISEDFARRGVSVPANRTVLTASTSDAYSLLFKLLCDPGDAVVAPRPSYPLIEHLTELDAVSLEHYRVEFHGRWELDLEELRDKARLRRVRAIVMINPNNPTGSVITERELNAVGAIAAEHGLAIISDEVFSDYAIAPTAPASALRQEHALTFALGGLSKSAGLPQVKLGWMAIGGPRPLVEEALERLETMCDAYLSVSTPVQIAAPDLLKTGTNVRAQIQDRVRANYQRLRAAAAGSPACAVLPVEAGWYAVVQIPAFAPEETIVVELLEQAGVLVHPGYFFDFDREAFLVVSLLPEPDVFASAIEAVFQYAGMRK